MLVNKKQTYEPKDILSIKLVNGDEIIARLVEETESSFIIENPLTVIPSERGIALIQTLFSADINKNIEVKFDHILLHAATVKQVADHYLQTTTGIVRATPGGIIA